MEWGVKAGGWWYVGVIPAVRKWGLELAHFLTHTITSLGSDFRDLQMWFQKRSKCQQTSKAYGALSGKAYRSVFQCEAHGFKCAVSLTRGGTTSPCLAQSHNEGGTIYYLLDLKILTPEEKELNNWNTQPSFYW